MIETLWAIVPIVDLPEMTGEAIGDLLAQEGVRVRVLVISNGSTPETRAQLEARFKCKRERVVFWWHHPPLLSLNATWNAALDFVWAAGGEVAWVVNNDVRLDFKMAGLLLEALRVTHAEKAPLFLSGVGVRPALPFPYEYSLSMRGGPDFSCYLITRECHLKYRMDEQFTYAGDVDTHRRMMLGGDGDRIFSVNVPYLHLGSQTINRADPGKQQHYRLISDMHHAAYARKWAGGCNQETARVPYGEPENDGLCTTTPDLQAHRCAGFHQGDGSLLDPDNLQEAIEHRQSAAPSEAAS